MKRFMPERIQARPIPRFRIAAVTLALAVAGCAYDAGDAASQSAGAENAIVLGADLLAAAPLGPARTDRMAEAAFLRAFESYRRTFPGLAAMEARSVDEAVGALEAYLGAWGPVVASVATQPTGLEVTYRPVYKERSDTDPGVTSDGTVRLEFPIDYWFDAADPFTGEVQSKRRACQFGCDVRFVFTPPADDAPPAFLLPDRPPAFPLAPPGDSAAPAWTAPADVVAVTFAAGLTRERKTELVRAAGGVALVGGGPLRADGLDGVYLVRIGGDGTPAALVRALETLNASPGVASAFVLLTDGGS